MCYIETHIVFSDNNVVLDADGVYCFLPLGLSYRSAWILADYRREGKKSALQLE